MEALLKKGLAELRLDEGATPSLLRFGELLLEKNKVMNLTAITEPADVAALLIWLQTHDKEADA